MILSKVFPAIAKSFMCIQAFALCPKLPFTNTQEIKDGQVGLEEFLVVL